MHEVAREVRCCHPPEKAGEQLLRFFSQTMFDFTSHRCDLFFLGAGGATRSSQHQHFSSLVDCLLFTHSTHEQTVEMKKMLAPFLFFFTNLNTMHMLHDVRLFSVTRARCFFSLSTI